MSIKNAAHEKFAKMTNSKSNVILLFITIICLSFLIINLCIQINNIINNDCLGQNVFIGNINVSNLTKDEAKNKIIASTSSNPDIIVNCNDKNVILKYDDFDYNTSIDNTINHLLNFPKNPVVLLNFINNTCTPTIIDLLPTKESINKNIAFISSQLSTPEIDAYVSCFNPLSTPMFTYESGQDGYEIDKNELEEKLVPILRGTSGGSIYLSTYYVKNDSDINDVKQNTQLIGEFSTISTNSENSTNNMKLALKLVNGTTLEPGEEFSFNKIVGNTSNPSRGFLAGASIFNGEVTMTYGGGICQAATTIYGAAVRANLTITERKNHTFKSSYVPYGEDATISYNTIDLKFRNDLEFPVYIRAFMESKTLKCQIYGPKSDRYDKIEVKSYTSFANNSTQVTSERIYYKDGQIVDRQPLPSSCYR